MDEKTQTQLVANPLAAATVHAPPAVSGLVSVEQQRAVAEVQARLLTARACPRDPIRATDMILNDCTRPALAQGALYAYSRGGSDVSGPTIRLAETMARRWGNIASGIKEISRGDGYSDCIAYAWDLETGYYDERQFRVRHWRDTKKGGYRIEDERDIYELVANMGQRRKRACLLSVLPGEVVEAAVAQCESTLNASADTSPEAVQAMVKAFEAFGVSRAQVEARIQRRLDSIRPAQVVLLRKIYASLRDGMSDPSEWFDPAPGAAADQAPERGAAGLKEAARRAAGGDDQPAQSPARHPGAGYAAGAPAPADRHAAAERPAEREAKAGSRRAAKDAAQADTPPPPPPPPPEVDDDLDAPPWEDAGGDRFDLE